jgi:hypothetical protein
MTKHHALPKSLENAGEFRLFIYELTESKAFGGAILVVILLNTVILVTQTDEAISVKAGKLNTFKAEEIKSFHSKITRVKTLTNFQTT